MMKKIYVLGVAIFIASLAYWFSERHSDKEDSNGGDVRTRVVKTPNGKDAAPPELLESTHLPAQKPIEQANVSVHQEQLESLETSDNEAVQVEAEQVSNQLQSEWHSKTDIRNDPNLDHEFIKRMDAELKQAAKDGNWTTFEFFADEVEQAFPRHHYSFALNVALRRKAPIEVIRAMVAKGGRLSYQHLYSVAKFNLHEYYYELKSLGLDVHLKGPDGQNALFPAKKIHPEHNVFLLLVMDNVDPNVEVNGRGLIDMFLSTITKTRIDDESNFTDQRYWSAVHNFFTLVRFGKAELKPRHLAALRQLRAERPQTFEVMTDLLPNKSDLLYRLDQL